MATIRQRSSGRWQAQVFVGGRLISKTLDTKRLATAWAAETEAARNRGEEVRTPSKITVADYYATLAAQRRAVLQHNTVLKNRTHWTLHLEPEFGPRRLVEIRRSDIASWVAERVGAGVGVPTIEGAIRLLSAIYEAAVGDDLVVANPVRGVRLPEHDPRGMRWIGPEEVDAIAAELEEPYRLLVELAAGTGLRWGEISGLLIGAVDPFGRSLKVRTTWTRQGMKDCPKNDSSRREVPIPDHLRSRVLAAMADKSRDSLLFIGPRGGGLSDRNVNERHLTPACVRVGVEPFTFHGLRHAYISWLVAGGMPLTEVAALVGHSSVRMIERTYAHLAPGFHDRARETLARAWGGHRSAIVLP